MIMTSFLMWPRKSLMRGNRCTRVSVRAWRNWRRRTHDDIDDPGTLGDRTDDLVVDLAWHAHHHSTHTHTSLTYVIAIYLNTYLSTVLSAARLRDFRWRLSDASRHCHAVHLSRGTRLSRLVHVHHYTLHPSSTSSSHHTNQQIENERM